jgi:AcrR family transcriptional regulator
MEDETGSGRAGDAGGGSRKTGRRRGVSGTRDLILAAARRQFAERGYQRTTMRSIAAEAGVDPSLVVHFFGTKKRLFDEAIDLPVDPEALRARITGVPPGQRGESLARFVVGLLHNPDYRDALTGLLRSAGSEPEVISLLRERHRRDILLPLVRDLDVDRAELRVALAATQVIGLILALHVTKFDVLGELPDEELAALVAPTLQRYLSEPLDPAS